MLVFSSALLRLIELAVLLQARLFSLQNCDLFERKEAILICECFKNPTKLVGIPFEHKTNVECVASWPLPRVE